MNAVPAEQLYRLANVLEAAAFDTATRSGPQRRYQ